MTNECMMSIVGARHDLPLCRSYLAVFCLSEPMQITENEVVVVRLARWAIGCRDDGDCEILGSWTSEGRSPMPQEAYWLEPFRTLSARGVERVGFVVHPIVDGQARAGALAWPTARVLPSVEVLLERSLSPVGPRVRGGLSSDLRGVVAAVAASEAERALSEIMGGRFAARYPTVAQTWRAALEQLRPLLELPVPIRRVILTTDSAVWSLHRNLLRSVERHGAFPSAQAAASFVGQVLRRAERALDTGRRKSTSSARQAAFGGASASLSQP